jgi:hypothetical protein
MCFRNEQASPRQQPVEGIPGASGAGQGAHPLGIDLDGIEALHVQQHIAVAKIFPAKLCPPEHADLPALRVEEPDRCDHARSSLAWTMVSG